MPNDLFYGADSELRIGLMADKDTDPTAWFKLEYMQFTAAASTERRSRAKLGGARHNALDPLKPRNGFKRTAIDVVLDADTLQAPRWLRSTIGAPTTGSAVGGIYPHVWESGSKTVQYCAIQVRPSPTSKVYVYRAVTFGALAFNWNAEQTQDFDLQLSLRGLKARTRVADWLSGSVAAAPTESPVLRTVFRVDGAAASDTLSGAYTYDRQLAEDVFGSTTPDVAGLRPNGGVHNGSATFRALGESFEDLEEGETVFAADHQLLGVATGHEIVLAHLQAQLDPAALSIQGEGVQDRAWSWNGFQTSASPAARLTVKNSVASYAT